MFKWFVNKTQKLYNRLFNSKSKDRLIIQNLYVLSAQEQIQALTREIKLRDQKRLEVFGYKVYSQNDEDGIIQEIFKRIKVTNKKFVEIGVGDGLENNTYFLFFKGWTGAWIEGSHKNAQDIRKRFHSLLHTHKLQIVEHYVDQENINQIFTESGLIGEIDLFSIDIDGNDYYVLKALDCLSPRVIVAEYNGKFPADVDWCMHYDSKHRWTGTDKMGVALLTQTEMLNAKGYQLVGTNITGSNAFYVKKELCKDLFIEQDIKELYNPARYHLTSGFVVGHPAKECII